MRERGDAEAVIVMRTGSEPTTARSALRARFWLTLWGLVWAVFGTTAFALTGRTGWAVACGVLWLIITVDLTVILHRLRQGPHSSPARTSPRTSHRTTAQVPAEVPAPVPVSAPAPTTTDRDHRP
ncbi:hypothetical protein SFUMM280S_05093 [Streptomyces fumanus]